MEPPDGATCSGRLARVRRRRFECRPNRQSESTLPDPEAEDSVAPVSATPLEAELMKAVREFEREPSR
jgi:hypothetical protein